ncbi:dipeptidase [Parendozoicomonas haliclonae]|uniref:Membrane dipeptidase (Peptidase family M19) n=1 Tax=Parendozoicomonas haliclonae TaxID=1960125 RepID=A0A1X7AMS7_9GAMM|nr:dipeptidase [Parendozoicomonas haliclonae]SMA49608.1 Membrane dipeptidase (Peptidase family M19) [Parendozoicomonas haliclonae]
MKRIISTGLPILVILTLLALWLLPPEIERRHNLVDEHEPYPVSDIAADLHKKLLVADLHTDSLLWSRDLRKESTIGHADLPRLREGNVAIQIFPAVTKSPAGQNYESNATEARDNITLLAVAQAWPTRTWMSLSERALYQSEKLHKLQEQVPEEVRVVRTSGDLQEVLGKRAQGSQQLAAILATEGSHALDGKLANIQKLYDAGYRMMGLQHFFDNKLGGSLHGTSNAGLSDFGRAAVNLMEEKSIIVDVAHSSPQVVLDTLAAASRPVVLSHTGFNGLCESPRNISDDLMKQIAAADGLIGVGFWEDAICDHTPAGIAKMIKYGISVVGEDHVALGTDFDGSVRTGIDVSELPALTDALVAEGLSEREIRKVMGENLRDFLIKWLPKS